MSRYDSRTPAGARRSRERSKDPLEVLAETEQQWIFTEDELLRTPSICDGMSPDDERQHRYKGNHFITQVGIMLKLPQTTLSTAAVFFNRYLMRKSLINKPPYKALHHYVSLRYIMRSSVQNRRATADNSKQIAAISLFLATKVEEHCRKIKEIVIACCRVAQKNPNLLVDEQTKDFWRWRDTIIYNEDVLLESLCFDLTIESPYKILYDYLRYYKVHNNKRLRDSAWSFINDSNQTQLCLLFTSKTIACAALYCGAKHAEQKFEDEGGRAWWEVQQVSLTDIRRACNYMADFYTNAPGGLKAGSESIYVGLRSPLEGDEGEHSTRLKTEQKPSMSPVKMERSGSEMSLKREREDDNDNTGAIANGNGHGAVSAISRVPVAAQDTDGRAAKRVRTEERDPTLEPATNGTSNKEEEDVGDAGSEEGELEE
jgi:protein BUR2